MPFNIGGEIYDSGSLATYGRNQLIQDGLVFHLDAAYANSYPEGGTSWYDLVSGSSGVLTNGPVYYSDYGGLIAFDGVNDGVVISDTSNLSLNEMTISSWNYSNNYFQDGFLFEKTTNGSVNTQYSLFFRDSDDNIVYRTYGLTNISLEFGPITSYMSNKSWNNIVATYDGSVKRVYINGDLKAFVSASGTVTQNNTGAAYIGAYGSLVDYFFNGNIANTMLYNRALSPGEILHNYNTLKGRFYIPEPPTYEVITLTTSSTITVEGNGTTSVDISKTGGSSAWDAHAYTSQSFTAPCTVEYNVENLYPVRKMISWNADPTTDASYSSLDWAAYLGVANSTEFNIYHNSTRLLDSEVWDDSYKMYLVYDTDGYIRHYNGSRLIYSVFKGLGGAVHLDTSFYEASTSNKFANVRITKNAWRGDKYYNE